jgi:hypothetical protein
MHVIKAMLGHSSVTTTEKYYAHFSPNYAARRALQVLEGSKNKKIENNDSQKNGTQMGRKILATEVA